MKIQEKNIVFGREMMILNSLRTIYWPAYQILLLSDLHVGKAAHFRRNGLAVPGTIGKADLDRLDFLFSYYTLKEVVIVGDILHAQKNSEVIQFRTWLGNYPDIRFTLVKGNHDRLKEKEWDSLGLFQSLKVYQIGNIQMVHEPVNTFSEDLFVISGHIHPGIEVKTLNKSKLRLPCFVVMPHQIILPAFSHFTGLYTQAEFLNAQYYAIGNEQIFVL